MSGLDGVEVGMRFETRSAMRRRYATDEARFETTPRCGGCGAELDVDVRDSGGNWFTVKRGVNPGYELDVCPATEDEHVPESEG